MTAQIIDGKAIAAQIYDEIKTEVAELKEKHGITPGLATVLVGENPASKAYVASKQKTCVDCGFCSTGEHLPEDATQEQVEAVVARFNADPNVHGILVQLPLPKHLDEERILSLINI
jgi:methylenetetrahydrofolate dehydrogenase (NADP+)/methenyltetrahydrofolate cyclohydrolase